MTTKSSLLNPLAIFTSSTPLWHPGLQRDWCLGHGRLGFEGDWRLAIDCKDRRKRIFSPSPTRRLAAEALDRPVVSGGLPEALLIVEDAPGYRVRVRDSVCYRLSCGSLGGAAPRIDHWLFPDWVVRPRVGRGGDPLARLCGSEDVPAALDLTARGLMLDPSGIANELLRGSQRLAAIAERYPEVFDPSIGLLPDRGSSIDVERFLVPGSPLPRPGLTRSRWGAAVWAWVAVGAIWPAMAVHWARLAAPWIADRFDVLDEHLPKLPDWLAAGVASASDDSIRAQTAGRLSDGSGGLLEARQWTDLKRGLDRSALRIAEGDERRRKAALRVKRHYRLHQSAPLTRGDLLDPGDANSIETGLNAAADITRPSELNLSLLNERGLLAGGMTLQEAEVLIRAWRHRVNRARRDYYAGRLKTFAGGVLSFAPKLRAWIGCESLFQIAERILRKCNAAAGLEPRTAPIPEQNTTPQAGME